MKAIWNELRRLYGAYEGYSRDNGGLMSAAAAYFLGLSLFPMLAVLIAGLGWFLQYTHSGQNAEAQVMQTVEQHVSSVVATQIQDLLGQMQNSSSVGGPIGIVTLLLTAIAGFAQFEQAFDRIWNVPAREGGGWIAAVRGVVFERLVAFVMLLGVAVIVFLAFVASTLMGTLQAKSAQFLPAPARFWTLLQTGTSMAANVVAFTLLYRLLPQTRVLWRAAFRGAIVVSLAWEVGRQVLAAFLIGTKYSSAYGIVGTFIGLLVWCYYACTIIFLGAEYVQRYLEECRGAPVGTAGPEKEASAGMGPGTETRGQDKETRRRGDKE